MVSDFECLEKKAQGAKELVGKRCDSTPYEYIVLKKVCQGKVVYVVDSKREIDRYIICGSLDDADVNSDGDSSQQ